MRSNKRWYFSGGTPGVDGLAASLRKQEEIGPWCGDVLIPFSLYITLFTLQIHASFTEVPLDTIIHLF